MSNLKNIARRLLICAFIQFFLLWRSLTLPTVWLDVRVNTSLPMENAMLQWLCPEKCPRSLDLLGVTLEFRESAWHCQVYTTAQAPNLLEPLRWKHRCWTHLLWTTWTNHQHRVALKPMGPGTGATEEKMRPFEWGGVCGVNIGWWLDSWWDWDSFSAGQILAAMTRNQS